MFYIPLSVVGMRDNKKAANHVTEESLGIGGVYDVIMHRTASVLGSSAQDALGAGATTCPPSLLVLPPSAVRAARCKIFSLCGRRVPSKKIKNFTEIASESVTIASCPKGVLVSERRSFVPRDICIRSTYPCGEID